MIRKRPLYWQVYANKNIKAGAPILLDEENWADDLSVGLILWRLRNLTDSVPAPFDTKRSSSCGEWWQFGVLARAGSDLLDTAT